MESIKWKVQSALSHSHTKTVSHSLALSLNASCIREVNNAVENNLSESIDGK